ncbi:hypothetical protein PoB_004192300 [Plakobranchus ocellatus]|uniref:Uncharacterized protein n=1 Tax=Plakobranchus ocellatus TaxID=259542 RepID=A0AAV4B9C1_9GAST|nr:hypothetical protein PoB_004192300 [Plakobranchus ocellatus]
MKFTFVACPTGEVSIWAHVVLPVCLAILVFVLLIVVLILWSRWRRQKYLRSKMEEAREKDVVSNVVFLEDESAAAHACANWTSVAGARADMSLIPRNPLVLSSDRGRNDGGKMMEGRRRSGDDVTLQMLDGLNDEGGGENTPDEEDKSRSSSSGCTDCPPESLDSPKIPFTTSQHSFLQMAV